MSVYGLGARSNETMEGMVDSGNADYYFRPVSEPGVDSPAVVFRCIHALCNPDFQIGDSGMWVWSEQGQLVGMAMAYTVIDNRKYCCILPMDDVLASIEYLLGN